MKDMKKIILAILIFSLAPLSLSAKASISNIEIDSLEDGSLSLSWSTDEPSTSFVFFGFSPDHLPYYIGGSEFKRAHRADLTGLKKDTDYYYKIMVTNEKGQVTESYTNYFNTNEMSLTQGLDILNFKKKQVIDQAIAFSFQTSRPAKVLVDYSYNNSSKKTWHNNSYKSSNLVIIKGLKSNYSYNFKITVTDEDGNYTSYSFRAKTSSAIYKQLKLENLKPSYQGQYPVFHDRAIISFNSNILSYSDIYYGTQADRLNKRLKVSAEPSLDHYLSLENLKPGTQYYYQIVLSSALNNLKETSLVYSFKTKDIVPKEIRASVKTFYQDGDLVSLGRNIYIIYDDYKFKVNYQPIIGKQEAKDISSLDLDAFSEQSPYLGPYHEGQILRVEGDRLLYLIYENTRRPLASWQVFSSLNYHSSEINYVSLNELKRYKLGAVVNRAEEISLNKSLNNKLVITEGGSTVYLLVNDKKLPFLSAQAFLKRGYNFSKIIKISEGELNKYQTGTPLF